jgi:hypothetical protein
MEPNPRCQQSGLGRPARAVYAVTWPAHPYPLGTNTMVQGKSDPMPLPSGDRILCADMEKRALVSRKSRRTTSTGMSCLFTSAARVEVSTKATKGTASRSALHAYEPAPLFLRPARRVLSWFSAAQMTLRSLCSMRIATADEWPTRQSKIHGFGCQNPQFTFLVAFCIPETYLPSITCQYYASYGRSFRLTSCISLPDCRNMNARYC